jgi:hypothetical protein
MYKHFTNFPEELEQYNPEALQVSDFANLETFDEQGQFHSFNDQPAHIVKGSIDNLENEFFWYKNNKIHREGDKPPIADARVDISYATYNDQYQRHSYNDLPSNIICYGPNQKTSMNDSFHLDWHKDDKWHRDNGKPASIMIKQGEIIQTTHYIKGVQHNENGPAHFGKKGSSWTLFGVTLPEKAFLSIISYQKEENVPLWVAFLCVLEVVVKDYVDTLRDESNHWNIKLPLEWQLRFLGVTNETLKTRINSNSSFRMRANDTSLTSLKTLIQYEEESIAKLKTLEHY